MAGNTKGQRQVRATTDLFNAGANAKNQHLWCPQSLWLYQSGVPRARSAPVDAARLRTLISTAHAKPGRPTHAIHTEAPLGHPWLVLHEAAVPSAHMKGSCERARTTAGLIRWRAPAAKQRCSRERNAECLEQHQIASANQDETYLPSREQTTTASDEI